MMVPLQQFAIKATEVITEKAVQAWPKTSMRIAQAKDSFSFKGVIATALLTMITTGTVQYLGDQALKREQNYWEKYSNGVNAKTRWWDVYLKTVTKNCAEDNK